MGKKIDIIPAIYDEKLLKNRGCNTLKLYDVSINCQVSLNHKLAKKEKIKIKDLYGEKVMLISRGWNKEMDRLRDELERVHLKIEIEDFNFYSLEVFNKCENEGNILIGVSLPYRIHLLLKNLEVNWNYKIPYGIIYPQKPNKAVLRYVEGIKMAIEKNEITTLI